MKISWILLRSKICHGGRKGERRFLDNLAFSDYFERLDQTSETLEIQETDTPTVRLLKARTYLMASGELLKRVIFVVVGDISINVPN